MTKPLPHIGSRELISFPDRGIEDVPAKVDTGADSSSIWATNIQEINGQLEFSLFGPESAFFTGDTVKSKDYTIVSVKNSFGTTEFRYKVAIPCVIGGRKIRVRFTLSNRSTSTFPILIGRRTLAGRFIVDVSKRHDANDPKRILIVSKLFSKNVQKLLQSTENELKNAVIDYATYEDIVVRFRSNVMSAAVGTTGYDLADYDIVHFKTSLERDITAALARYAEFKGVKVVDGIVKYFPTTSKLYQYAVLSIAGIPIPDSMFLTPGAAKKGYKRFVENLGEPFILKDIHGSKGKFNEVIRSQKDFNEFVARAKDAGVYLIGQAFLENEGDYRILVTSKKIALVIYRSRKDKASTHLNNTSQGAEANLVSETELPPDVKLLSLRAAELMERDIAGIDMVCESSTGKWYCFEVNDGPQIATGSFLIEKQKVFANYLKTELEKRI